MHFRIGPTFIGVHVSKEAKGDVFILGQYLLTGGIEPIVEETKEDSFVAVNPHETWRTEVTRPCLEVYLTACKEDVCFRMRAFSEDIPSKDEAWICVIPIPSKNVLPDTIAELSWKRQKATRC